MLIVGIADRPSAESFAVVPFIVRMNDGRLLVAGHGQAVIEEERLQWLYRNPIGAHDVTSVGAKLDVFDRGLKAGWVGGVFMAQCRALGAQVPEVPESAHALRGEGRFWIGPAAEIEASRQAWVDAAARRAIRLNDRLLAKLMLQADPWAPEREAAVWFTCETEEERENELQWFSQVVAKGRRRTKKEVAEEIRKTVDRLRQD